MKKFILIIIFTIILTLTGFISILATKGFETNRFNSLISSEIQKFEQKNTLEEVRHDLKKLGFID